MRIVAGALMVCAIVLILWPGNMELLGALAALAAGICMLIDLKTNKKQEQNSPQLPAAFNEQKPTSPPEAPAVQSAATGTLTLPRAFLFEYRDHLGEQTSRHVTVASISRANRKTYLEGYCHTHGAERTFRTANIVGDLIDAETGEMIPVARLLAAVRDRTEMTYHPIANAAPAPEQRAPRQWQTAVLFTGFQTRRKQKLEEIAEAAGFDVRTHVGSTLDYLVTGPNAGPSKTATAQSLGVSVIDEDTFLALAAPAPED